MKANSERVDEELCSESRKPATGKTNLLKLNSKSGKKKKLFNELSFAEPHVDTFYIGLNDSPVHSAYNPVHAKVAGVEEAGDWVCFFIYFLT
jgi:hypothetical protein